MCACVCGGGGLVPRPRYEATKHVHVCVVEVALFPGLGMRLPNMCMCVWWRWPRSQA